MLSFRFYFCKTVMAEIKLVHVPGQKPIRILKWLVKKGEMIKHGTPLAVYRTVEDPSKQIKSKEIQLKSKHVGKVKMFLMHEGQVAIPEGVLLEIEGCIHRVVMKEMCAECGQDLRTLNEVNSKREKQKSHSATVSMIPSIPELRISAEQAEEIAQEDKNRLHRMKKLVLLVDLDQTLIHTTQDPGLAALCQSDDDFYTFQLSKNDPVLFTKLRPHCREFLKEVSQCYELQIVTFGSRQYAHKIADFIDKEKKYFAHRILSRNECIHPFKKSGNLRHLFPCGDSMVCIIDDRDDVWNAVPNLIMVKKYNYFQGTGDINNPYKDRYKGEKGTKKDEKTEAQLRRKRKSEGEDEEMSGAKRTKEDMSGNDEIAKNDDDVTESTKLDANENKIEGQLEAAIDDDLNMSSDSDSSSDTSSISSSSGNSSSDDEENTQESQVSQNSAETKEISEDCEKKDSKAIGDKENSLEENSKLENGSLPSENLIRICKNGISESNNDLKNNLPVGENKKQNGEATDTEGNTSSGETMPVSSQESELRERNSQEILANEVSGFSGASQEFTTTLSSQESADDSRMKFQDSDDYLHYLRDILLQIHSTYYEAYDKYLNKEFKDLPDVRGVVPFLRSKVLYGCFIVFTGVIPQTFHLPPHHHRAHIVVRQLGARVEENVSDKTTHLIAGKKGTTKYQEALKRKKQNIKLVSVDWLWCCSERWEKVEEKVFPVPDKFVEPSIDQKLVQVSKPEKISQPDSSDSLTNTYDSVTGKLIKRVQDPRFSFMIAESQHRRKEENLQTPLYSSLQVPNAVVSVAPAGKPEKIQGKNSKDNSDDQKSGKIQPSVWKHNPLSKSNTSPGYKAASRSRKRSMAEIVGYGYSLSTDDIADMDKEVDDLLGSSDEEEEEKKDFSKGPSLSDQQSSSKNFDNSKESSDKKDEALGTVIEELKDSPTIDLDTKEESTSSDEDEGESSDDDDEMAALLNAEMHYDDEEDDND